MKKQEIFHLNNKAILQNSTIEIVYDLKWKANKTYDFIIDYGNLLEVIPE